MMRSLSRRGLLALQLSLMATAAFAQDALTVVERQWRSDSSSLTAAFRTHPAVRIDHDGHVVEIVRSAELDPEWLPNAGGQLELKTSWVGDLWLDGRVVGTDNVVATTYDSYTWVSITTPQGGMLLFPDGRVEYSRREDLRCGTATAVQSLLADSKKKPRVPKTAVVTDGVLYTPQAEEYWGGAEATRARLLNYQDVQNVAFAQSGLSWLTVRFVGFYRDATWNEAWQDASQGDVLTNRFALSAFYKALRKQWKANVMTMFATRMPGSYGGVALRAGQYKLVNAIDTTGGTYVHELGHNLGLPHTKAYVRCATNPTITTDDGFSTVMVGSEPPVGMSFPLCGGYGFERVLRYSNKDPAVTYFNPYTGGTYPTGDALHSEYEVVIKFIARNAAVTY